MASTGQPRNNELDDYETIIGINNTHAVNKFVKPDLIVAMDDLERDVSVEPEYVKAITEQGCPVLSTRSFEQWPNVQPYPLDEVVNWLEDEVCQGDLPACKFLDNSINYAIALCLARGVKKIGLSGVQLTAPYRERDLSRATSRWKKRGYGHAPWWFRYYDRQVLKNRFAQEAGWEAMHCLIGFGLAKGVWFEWGSDASIMNSDREDFYYGYNDVEL